VYAVGKFLQALGLVLVPLALYYGISKGEEQGAIAAELGILGAGAAIFVLGRWIESKAR
jgi:hypothetical protein